MLSIQEICGIRKKITLVGDNLHPQDYIIKYAVMTTHHSKIRLVSPEEFIQTSGFPENYAKHLSEMFCYLSEFGFCGKQSWDTGKKLVPGLKNWEQFLLSERQILSSP